MKATSPGSGPRWLWGILALAAAVRLWGVTWGLPRVDLHPDEQMVLQIVQRLRWDQLDPGFYNYSGLTFYLHFLASEIARALGVAMTDANQLLAHRLVSVVQGTLTVLLVYPIARGLRLRRGTALTAAAVMALVPLHVWDSHVAVADIGLAFFCTLALWLALRAYEEPTLRRFLVGGAAVGAAMATKFNGALSGITFAVAALSAWREGRASGGRALRSLAAAGATSLAAFALLSPYSVAHLPEMLGAFNFEWSEVNAGHYGFDLTAAGWQYHRGLYQLLALFPFAFGLALWPVVLLGAWCMTRRTPAGWAGRLLAWSFVALYLATVGSWMLVPLRYYLPLLPMGAVFAACGLHRLWQWRPRLRWAGRALAIAVAAYTAVFTAATTYRFTDDTRVQAARWGDVNLPPGARVYFLYPGYRHSYVPLFTREDLVVRLVPLERARTLAAAVRRFPGMSFVVTTSLTYARDYRQGDKAQIAAAHRRWHGSADPVADWEFVRDNPEMFRLEKRFSAWFPNKRLYEALDPMYGGYFVSPTIEIYRSQGDRERAARTYLGRSRQPPAEEPERQR